MKTVIVIHTTIFEIPNNEVIQGPNDALDMARYSNQVNDVNHVLNLIIIPEDPEPESGQAWAKAFEEEQALVVLEEDSAMLDREFETFQAGRDEQNAGG